ncbi:MAG: recombinase family protein, partial [Deltaproteobacteria bacterium]|nr:recombinase family protein [Deltaproteobacteria bacterium]
MNDKIQDRHKNKLAYIYIRQSTMGQVYHNQESTERQYRLKEKALQLGWTLPMIKTLDQDLGVSGSQ